MEGGGDYGPDWLKMKEYDISDSHHPLFHKIIREKFESFSEKINPDEKPKQDLAV
jgi:hypothetical protein